MRAVGVLLVMARGRDVGVVAEGVGIAVGKDFHHPAVKVVHRVVHDRFETAVIFSMSFFNVVFQSDAEIFLFAPEPYLLRSQHFDVLHRNFRHAIGAPVQFLFFRRESADVKVPVHLRFAGDRRRGWLHRRKRRRLGVKLGLGFNRLFYFWLGMNLGGYRYWLRR